MKTIEEKLEEIKKINIKKDVVESNLSVIIQAKENSIDKVSLSSTLFDLPDLSKTEFELPESETKKIIHIIETHLTTTREQLIIEAEKIINDRSMEVSHG